MNNLLFGIITLIFCLTGYSLSWRYRLKDNYRIAVLLLMLSGLALRVFTSADFFLHTWDEQFHALVAKNLLHHPLVPTLYDNPVLPFDYRNWTANHIWLHKQPLPLWVMAGSFRLFGVNEIALRLPSILLSTIGIGLAYGIGSHFFNRKAGYLAAFFFSINGFIIELAAGRVATDHYDIFYLFFIELAVFLTVQFVRGKGRFYNILAGLALGCAILTKWLPALIVLPIWLLVVYDSGKFSFREIFKYFLILIFSAALIALPWQIYINQVFPAEAGWEAGQNFRHLTTVIEGNTGPFYYYLDRIRINYGELIYLPLLWFIWRLLKRPVDLKRLGLAIWVVVPLLFFSFAKTKMQGYMLIAAPAFFLITSDFFLHLADWLKTRRFRWFYQLILVLLIALPVRYAIERIKPFDNTDRAPRRIEELKRLNERMIQKGVLFGYKRPVEAMFYTGLPAYSFMPDSTMVNELMGKGYSVIIYTPGDSDPFKIHGSGK